MNDSGNTPGIGTPIPNNSEVDIDQLLRKLRDFDDNVRSSSAQRLGKLTEKRAVQALCIRLANDKTPKVRLSAAEALYQINDGSAWPTIANTTSSDPSPVVRAKCVEILGSLEMESYAPVLIRALEDQDPQVSNQAAESLWFIKSENYILDIIQKLSRLEHPVDSIDPMKKALVKIGSRAAHCILTNSKELDGNCSGYYIADNQSFSFVLPVGSHRYYYGEYAYPSKYYLDRIDTLVEMGKPVIRILSQYHKFNRATVRVIVTRSLSIIDDIEVIPFLCQILSQDQDDSIRWLAAEGLEKQFINDPQKASEALMGAMKDTSRYVRWRAITALGNRQYQNAWKSLCDSALKDEDLGIRLASIRELGNLKNTQALPTLGIILLDSPLVGQRAQAAISLGAIGSTAACDDLLSALGSDGSVDVRLAAIQGLQSIHDLRVLAPLRIVEKNDPDQSVREAAKIAAEKF